MADGKYYSRGDKTNVVLSHEEVLRLHERLLLGRTDLVNDARAVLDSIPVEVPLLAVVAEPLGFRDDLLVDLTDDQDWENLALGLVQEAVVAEHNNFAPAVGGGARGFSRRAEGVAVTTGMNESERFEGKNKAAEVIFHESGRLTLISERPALMWALEGVNPPRQPQKVLFEELIVGNTDLVVRLAASVSSWAKYAGSWRFAIAVQGLSGAGSWLLAERSFGGHGGSGYTADDYVRGTERSLADITEDPSDVVRDLTMPLLRSVGTQRHPKLAWLRPQERT